MNTGVQKLLADRYFLEGESEWQDIAKRVSVLYPPIEPYIVNMEFIPSSPTLMNANTKGKKIGTLSSCFPMDIDDSIEDIFNALHECSLVTKYGGGIGIDVSVLRSSKESVMGIGGRNSSGPLPFVSIFNEMLDGVAQGGARRGAGMCQLNIDHPDILNFIKAKQDITKYTRFNFSIRIPNYFYALLEKSPDTIHKVYLKTKNEWIDLINEDNKKVTVKQLWNLIIHQAWKTGEPGIFNSDIAVERCTHTNISKHILSNPCQEFISIPYSSCNLGSINLAKFVDIDSKKFNWEKYSKIIVRATNYLNAVIDNNVYPIKKIKKITNQIRPIGLGTMGLAHAFYLMQVPYNSEQAIKFTDELYRYTTLCSMKQSIELAKQNKKTYEAYDYNLFIQANERLFRRKKCREIEIECLLKDLKKYGVYNATHTSIAPSGTISTIAQTSSGIEPVFALTYSRKIEIEKNQYDVIYITDPIFKQYLNINFNEKIIQEILKQVSNNKGSCQSCKEIPEEMKKIFITAGDLSSTEHLNILEKVSNGISLSVSKTINMPTESTEKDVSDVYINAYKKGIIGVTIYRNGCREGILVHNDNFGEKIIQKQAPKRPKILVCHVYRITVKGEKWIVFVGLFNGDPYEVFAGKINGIDIPNNIEDGYIVKTGKKVYQFIRNDEIIVDNILDIFETGEQEALTRQISTSLRHGTPIDFIQEQLLKSKGSVVDFNKAIARALTKYLKQKKLKEKCIYCGEELIFIEGCVKCPYCGWSRCQ